MSAVTRVVTVAVPALLVLASVGLLGMLAVGTLFGVLDEGLRYRLFGLGVGAWMAGVAWGVLVNGGRAAA